jgi:DNA-binding response OmpR family regulator
MNHTILIVDDEDDICMILAYSLQQAGYQTLVAHSAEEALHFLQITQHKIHLILLDVMMDQMSGTDMIRYMQEQQMHIPPVIFLTALSTEANILQGFSLGADDYITKPFHISEVLARTAAVIRRTNYDPNPLPIDNTSTNENVIKYLGVSINKHDMSLTVDGTPVTITRKEIDLLCYLLTHRGQVLSRQRLLDEVWDNNGFVLERTVDVHITHLRRKLGPYGKHIITKSGYGYMFES